MAKHFGYIRTAKEICMYVYITNDQLSNKSARSVRMQNKMNDIESDDETSCHMLII